MLRPSTRVDDDGETVSTGELSTVGTFNATVQPTSSDMQVTESVRSVNAGFDIYIRDMATGALIGDVVQVRGTQFSLKQPVAAWHRGSRIVGEVLHVDTTVYLGEG